MIMKEPKYCGWSIYLCGYYICSITGIKCIFVEKCPLIGDDTNYDRTKKE